VSYVRAATFHGESGDSISASDGIAKLDLLDEAVFTLVGSIKKR